MGRTYSVALRVGHRVVQRRDQAGHDVQPIDRHAGVLQADGELPGARPGARHPARPPGQQLEVGVPDP